VTTAALPLQVAVREKLLADTALMDAIHGVHDEVPENAPYPYVVIGDVTEVPADAHDRQGLTTTITLHIWSKYRGFKQALEILGHLDRVLDRKPLTVAGFEDVSIAREWHQTLRDPDPQYRHIPVRFRVWLTAAPEED
jgi:hypothetical protein